MAERHKNTALSRIGDLTADLDRADADRRRQVARAVHHGATWPEIADALGVTTQSAHRRFRWLAYDPQTGQAWDAKPLPLS